MEAVVILESAPSVVVEALGAQGRVVAAAVVSADVGVGYVCSACKRNTRAFVVAAWAKAHAGWVPFQRGDDRICCGCAGWNGAGDGVVVVVVVFLDVDALVHELAKEVANAGNVGFGESVVSRHRGCPSGARLWLCDLVRDGSGNCKRMPAK